MMELNLMQETVETRSIAEHDIIVIDYTRKYILAVEACEIETLSEHTEVSIDCILHCIKDHENRTDRDDFYLINGYTFLTVSAYRAALDNKAVIDIMRKQHSSVESSKKLYEVYGYAHVSTANPVELLNLETGEIKQFYNIILALESIDASMYDILKIPLCPGYTCTDYEYYVFPVIYDNFILRLNYQFLPWTEYVNYALGEPEVL